MCEDCAAVDEKEHLRTIDEEEEEELEMLAAAVACMPTASALEDMSLSG